MCIIEDLVLVSMCQEHAIPGYVEPTDDVSVGIALPKVELKHNFPLFGDVIRDHEGDWLVISGGAGALLAAPTMVRTRKLSDKNIHNKSDLAKPYQIRMFQVAELKRETVQRATWIALTEWEKQFFADPELLRNEVPLGSYDHITTPVDVEIAVPIREPEVVGVPPIMLEPWWQDFVAGRPPKASGGHISVKWAHPEWKPFRFEDCSWYQDMIKRH